MCRIYENYVVPGIVLLIRNQREEPIRFRRRSDLPNLPYSLSWHP